MFTFKLLPMYLLLLIIIIIIIADVPIYTFSLFLMTYFITQYFTKRFQLFFDIMPKRKLFWAMFTIMKNRIMYNEESRTFQYFQRKIFFKQSSFKEIYLCSNASHGKISTAICKWRYWNGEIHLVGGFSNFNPIQAG